MCAGNNRGESDDLDPVDDIDDLDHGVAGTDDLGRRSVEHLEHDLVRVSGEHLRDPGRGCSPRLSPCPNPQYPGSGGVITSCHGLPATGSPFVAGLLVGAGLGISIGTLLLTWSRSMAERNRRRRDGV